MRIIFDKILGKIREGEAIPGYANNGYPQVNTFAELPAAAGHYGEVYIVLTTTGFVWNQKEKGFYRSDGVNWEYLGELINVFEDELFKIYDSTDPTKFVSFDVANVSPNTVRTLNVPNEDGVIALVANVPTLSAFTSHTGDTSVHLTQDVSDAIYGSGAPSASNVFATIADLIAGSGDTKMVKTSGTDTTEGFLIDKLSGDTYLSLTKLNPGGNEIIKISTVNLYSKTENLDVTTNINISGITTIYNTLIMGGYSVTGISNDSGLTDSKQTDLVTEYAVKRYIDNASSVTYSTSVSSAQTYVDTNFYKKTDSDNRYVNITGDTMSGHLTVPTLSAQTIQNLNNIDFNTGSTITNKSGRLFYDELSNSLSYNPNIVNNDVTLNIGQEHLIYVHNISGYDILNGQACHVDNSNDADGHPSIVLASASSPTDEYQVSGIATHDILNDTLGFITKLGIVHDIVITGTTIGSSIYLSETPGQFEYDLNNLLYTSRISRIGRVISTGLTGAILVDISNEDGRLLTNRQRDVLIPNDSSTGIYNWSGMTYSGNTVTISQVLGWTIDNSSPLSPIVTQVNYPSSAITTPYLTTDINTYILITSASTLHLQPTFPTPEQRRSCIFIGSIVHPNNTNIQNLIIEPDIALSPISQLRDMFNSIRYINDGIVSSPLSALTFQTSAGSLYGFGINWANNNMSPMKQDVSGKSPVTFQYRTQIIDTGTTFTTISNINPNNYDVAGVVTTVPGNDKVATNQRIYISPSGLIRIQYGQNVYSTLSEAISASQTESFVVTPSFANNLILIGLLSIRKGSTDLTDTNHARFIPVSKFGENIGGAAGVSTTTLQQAYNNSTSPEIVTNSTLDGVQFRGGTGGDNSKNIIIENNSSVETAWIKANGDMWISSLSSTTVSAVTFYGNLDWSYLTNSSHTHTTSNINDLSTYSGFTNYYTKTEVYNTGETVFAGFVTYSNVVDNEDGTITIPTETVSLYDNANFTGIAKRYTLIGGTTSSDFPDLANNTVVYVVGDYNGGSPKFSFVTDPGLINRSNMISYITLFRSGGDVRFINWDKEALGTANKLVRRFIRTERIQKETGLALSETSTPSGRTVLVTNGIVWNGVNRQTIPSYNSSGDTLYLWYHATPTTWTFETGTTYNNYQYDNGSGLVSLTTGYTVNWIYKSIAENYNEIGIVLGSAEYSTLAAAELSQPSSSLPPSDLPPYISATAILVGRIIVKSGEDTGQVESAFSIPFTKNVVTRHYELNDLQGGSGTTELYHLTLNDYNNVVSLTDTYYTSAQTNAIFYTSAQTNTILTGYTTYDFVQPLYDIHTDTEEPSGFVDQTQCDIDFVNSSRTFSIYPTSLSYKFYYKGTLNNISTTKTIILPDITDVYYIAFSGNTLVTGTTFFDLENVSPVSYVMWYSNTQNGILFDERHGCVMDWKTHEYLHLSNGARVYNSSSDFILNEYNVAPVTPDNSDNLYGILGGTIQDEDYNEYVSELISGTTYALFYLSGSTWYPEILSLPVLTGSSYIMCNSGGTLQELSSGQYVNYYVTVTNAHPHDTNEYRFVIIPGQRIYNSLSSAQVESISDLDLSVLPFNEIAILYQLTYGTDSSYTTTGKYRIETEPFRLVGAKLTGVQTRHNSLSYRDLSDSHPSIAISTNVSTFGGILNSSDINVQLALNKIDDHNHNTLYYQKSEVYNTGQTYNTSETYTKNEVNNLVYTTITGTTTGTTLEVFSIISNITDNSSHIINFYISTYSGSTYGGWVRDVYVNKVGGSLTVNFTDATSDHSNDIGLTPSNISFTSSGGDLNVNVKGLSQLLYWRIKYIIM